MLIAVTWLSVFVCMGLLSYLSGYNPSSRWLVPFGVLAVATGLHLIYFRRENSEYFSRQRARWRLETVSQSPSLMIFYGLTFILIGLVFIYGGITAM